MPAWKYRKGDTMKTTKITSLLTALAMLTGTAATMPMMMESAIAGSATSVPEFTGTYEQLVFKNHNGDIIITDCQLDATEVVIPAEIDNCPVVAIGANAFRGCKKLTSVTIPDGVTGIGDDAFLQCYNLASVNIPDGVTYIGEGAFSETALTTVTIPDSVYEFGAGAFSFCDSLKEFAISEDSELYQVIDGVLFNNAGRTLVAYPCGKTGDTYTVPSEVTKIGDGAFSGSSLKSVIIPDGVTIVGAYAFNMCNILESVTIPDSVVSIGDSAFCFDDGHVPEAIYYSGSEEQWNEIYIYDGNEALEETTIHYEWKELLTTGVLTYTKHGDHVIIRGCDESATEVEIPAEIDGVPVTSIDKEAFKGCTDLTSVTIPDSVTSIGKSAFSGCYNLTSITIPDGVTSIEDYAFSGCSALSSITIPDSVTSIGKAAFEFCSGLTSITIPDSVTSIGERAFMECSGLTSITIPDGVTSIGERTFMECFGLTSVTIPEGVTTIGNWAFADCTDLTSVTIPDSVTSIGVGAFAGCSGLTSITIPDSVTSIGAVAFMDLEAVIVSEGNECYKDIDGVLFTKDGASIIAFPNGKKCDTYTIPDSVTSIGDYAFWCCSGLTSITIPGSVTSIGDCAFDSCEGLTDVYYVGSEKDWKAIVNGEDNEPLLNAAIHYNYVPESVASPGNINGDDAIDATDAALLLSAAAAAGAGGDSGLTAEQIAAADLDGNGSFDASDASLILMYAAYSGAGGELGITEFLAQL